MTIALQRLKDEDARAFDLPAPGCQDKDVLVQTQYAVISSATDLSIFVAVKSSLLRRALQRPEEFGKVLKALKRKAVGATYHLVTGRLEQDNAMGYSSSRFVVNKGKFALMNKYLDPRMRVWA